MRLRAHWNDKDIVAPYLTSEEWEAVRACSRKHGGAGLVMPCCGARAVPKHTPGRQHRYFAHYDTSGHCPFNGESLIHLEAKLAAAEAARSHGWNVTVEMSRANWRSSHDAEGLGRPASPDSMDWEADVLASRGAGRPVHIAFEIQRSGQGMSKTGDRDERYLADNVIPFWLFFPSFQASRQPTRWKTVLPEGSKETLLRGVRTAVSTFLQRLERHNRVARAVVLALKALDVPYEISYLANIPVCIRAVLEERRQDFLIAELDGLHEHPLENAQQIGGAPAVLAFDHREAKRHGDRSIILDPKKNLAEQIKYRVAAILKGRLVWQGSDRQAMLPAALVGYDDICPSCQAPYYHFLGCIVGHTLDMPGHRPRFIPHRHYRETVDYVIEGFKKRTGKACAVSGGPFSGALCCPHCRAAVRPLFSAAKAPSWPGLSRTRHGATPAWPYQDIDTHIRDHVHGAGWTKPTPVRPRRPPAQAAWEDFLEHRRALRLQKPAREAAAAEDAKREAHQDYVQRRDTVLDLLAVAFAAAGEAQPKFDINVWANTPLAPLHGETADGACRHGHHAYDRLMSLLSDLAEPGLLDPADDLDLPAAVTTASRGRAARNRIAQLQADAVIAFTDQAQAEAWSTTAPDDTAPSPIDRARAGHEGLTTAQQLLAEISAPFADILKRRIALEEIVRHSLLLTRPHDLERMLSTPLPETEGLPLRDFASQSDEHLALCKDLLKDRRRFL